MSREHKDLKFQVNPEFFKDLMCLCDHVLDEVRAGKVTTETRDALALVLSWTPLIAPAKSDPTWEDK